MHKKILYCIVCTYQTLLLYFNIVRFQHKAKNLLPKVQNDIKPKQNKTKEKSSIVKSIIIELELFLSSYFEFLQQPL